jgi:hypothetical protein
MFCRNRPDFEPKLLYEKVSRQPKSILNVANSLQLMCLFPTLHNGLSQLILGNLTTGNLLLVYINLREDRCDIT